MISNDTGIPIRRHSIFRWVVTISLAAILIGFGVYRYKLMDAERQLRIFLEPMGYTQEEILEISANHDWFYNRQYVLGVTLKDEPTTIYYYVIDRDGKLRGNGYSTDTPTEKPKHSLGL